MGPNGTQGGQGPTGADLRVRAADDADAATAARFHADRIDQGFLSFLGTGFLTRLYRRISRTPGSFLLVAVDDQAAGGRDGGGVVGFIAGSSDVGGLYRRFVLYDGVPAGLAAAPRLARGWRRMLETLRHGSGGSGTGRGTELLAVAVDPDHGGRGVGTALVDAFLARTVADGGTAAYVVVGADNATAIGLYSRCGFTTAGEFELHAGTRSVLMQWDRPAA